MYRLYKKYSLSASYDGIPPDTCYRSLDKIECAGQARTMNIYNTGKGRGLRFVEALTHILYFSAFVSLLLVPVASLDTDSQTAEKWKPHLDVLMGSGLLAEWPLSRLKSVARYFAVPKGDTEARAIVNLRNLSKKMKSPASTNLPEA